MKRGFASLMTTVQISTFRTVTLEVPDTRRVPIRTCDFRLQFSTGFLFFSVCVPLS